MAWDILTGDCLEQLKTLPSESVNCCVTSPPYWALRDYNHSDQLGLEPTFDEYIDRLCGVFDEVRRVLRSDGTLWVNIGDTYAGSGNGTNDYRTDASKSLSGKRFDYNQMFQGKQVRNANNGVPDKSLCMIPFRFAIEMVNRGWILRNVIIWHKPNCMPSSVKDRFTVDFEYVYFFVKSRRYWFETQYEASVESSDKVMQRAKSTYNFNKNDITGGMSVDSKNAYYAKIASGDIPIGRNKRAVWTVDSKFADIEQEAEYRQGMSRDRGNNMVEKRDLPDKNVFIDTIRERYTVNELIALTGLSRTTIEHWFRYDECFSYPRKEDWEKVGTDLFPELLEVYYEPDEIKSDANGRIKRSVWRVTTRPFKSAHFATYPEELIWTPIKAGCPADGVVLDPFCGSGTTGVVALKQGKRFIGIELNPEYVEMAEKRISEAVAQVNTEQIELFGGDNALPD